MSRTVFLAIEHADVTAFRADVLALKHAEGFHEADGAVATRLGAVAFGQIERATEHAGGFLLIDAHGGIQARQVMFLGVGRLGEFRYPSMRRFAVEVLERLGDEAPQARHLAMTIHGPNHGLDEREALLSIVGGLLEGLRAGEGPEGLERVSIVDRDGQRVARLRDVLAEALACEPDANRGADGYRLALAVSGGPGLQGLAAHAHGAVPASPAEKRHVFVAMPFSEEVVDVFYYGIQAPIHKHGFICERIDHSTFVGDIVEQIRAKIDSAAVVVADLTGSNPNVYLEVGYAWGRGKPVILIARRLAELEFDVRGQKCLGYSSFKDLEEKLDRELESLQAQHAL